RATLRGNTGPPAEGTLGGTGLLPRGPTCRAGHPRGAGPAHYEAAPCSAGGGGSGTGGPHVRHTAVDGTPLFSLRENAIAKEPGSSYPERWPCVSRLGASLVAQTPWSLPRMGL